MEKKMFKLSLGLEIYKYIMCQSINFIDRTYFVNVEVT